MEGRERGDRITRKRKKKATWTQQHALKILSQFCWRRCLCVRMARRNQEFTCVRIMHTNGTFLFSLRKLTLDYAPYTRTCTQPHTACTLSCKRRCIKCASVGSWVLHLCTFLFHTSGLIRVMTRMFSCMRSQHFEFQELYLPDVPLLAHVRGALFSWEVNLILKRLVFHEYLNFWRQTHKGRFWDFCGTK